MTSTTFNVARYLTDEKCMLRVVDESLQGPNVCKVKRSSLESVPGALSSDNDPLDYEFFIVGASEVSVISEDYLLAAIYDAIRKVTEYVTFKKLGDDYVSYIRREDMEKIVGRQILCRGNIPVELKFYRGPQHVFSQRISLQQGTVFDTTKHADKIFMDEIDLYVQNKKVRCIESVSCLCSGAAHQAST